MRKKNGFYRPTNSLFFLFFFVLFVFVYFSSLFSPSLFFFFVKNRYLNTVLFSIHLIPVTIGIVSILIFFFYSSYFFLISPNISASYNAFHPPAVLDIHSGSERQSLWSRSVLFDILYWVTPQSPLS
eukprot:13724_6